MFVEVAMKAWVVANEEKAQKESVRGNVHRVRCCCVSVPRPAERVEAHGATLDDARGTTVASAKSE